MDHGVWKSVVAEIELTISRAAFATWFKNTEVLEENESTIVEH